MLEAYYKNDIVMYLIINCNRNILGIAESKLEINAIIEKIMGNVNMKFMQFYMIMRLILKRII